MNEEKKSPQENGGEQKRKFNLGTIFFHNTFVLVFSFCVALISWFILAAGDTESNWTIRDVPIEVKTSAAAGEDGLEVFNMSYNSVDLEVSGNNLITSKLTADDFDVSVTLNPTSTKLTGNTMQKMTLKVQAVKKGTFSDYNIVSINPEEVNVEYDRKKEITLPIENEVKFSVDAGYAASTASFSESEIVISGPESSVNKISKAAVNYTVGNPLRADENVTCPVRLYDQNNQELEDTAGLYLKMSVDTVEVTIPVLPKKTVRIVANTVNQPKGFADSRIAVEPSQIEIAGPADVLSGIQEIALDTPINFADLDINQKNVVTLDIPLPAGVRNISAAGDNTVSQATVSVNLNGYKKVSVTATADNIQISNPPAGKTPVLNTQLLDVSLIGSEAQVSKLTGDSLSVQADLTNFADSTGSVEVPVTITISSSGADSCWVVGKYTVSVSLSEQNAFQAEALPDSSDAVNAAPQE